MKPVVIFRHARTEGPGYLGAFLTAKRIPWQLICIDQGEALPESMEAYSGMVLMGGPMSVNDDLPWIQPLLALIRDAVQRDIPLLGHCLGGQLISKALGAEVSGNPVKEIGWGEVELTPGDEARKWFGNMKRFDAFHWHGETFALPQGAVHLLSSRYCQNQAYSIGKHLAFQCHMEMTLEMVKDWSEAGADELQAEIGNPAVQTAVEMQRNLQQRIARLNEVSHYTYERWIEGLRT
ncbi:MAG: glutamine amidotransferase [Betaproteobacteria bacterium HGW-Betaproteobacteria-8]|nr:MAG: glutamine amidotransferase [Betaproteobacteria bacterium HGW-Betaproteobacteria-8]